MKAWKKLGAAMLSAVMLAGIMAACSSGGNSNGGNAGGAPAATAKPSEEAGVSAAGFPIVQQPLQLKFFAQKSPPNGPYEEMLMFKEYEKMTNIDIVWEDVPSEGFAEKKNLLFASNELPDAFFKSGISPLEAVRYGSSGMLIPLEGYIDEYAPNLKALLEQYPEILSSITAPDGHIYALPAVVTLGAGRTDKHWINQSWLTALSLDEPTTTVELLEVLRAFRDRDPNNNGEQDEIPMSGWDRNAVINAFAGAWGLDLQMGYNISIQNDKVHIWLGDSAFRETLMYINLLFTEKLLDQELFTQNPSQYVAKMASGNLGYFHNQASDPFAAMKENFKGIAPVAGPHGDRKATGRPVARDFGTFAITSVNKHPEATMRWIDYFYGEEGSIFFRYGKEGETYTIQSDGTPEYTEAILIDSRGTGTTIGQFTPWPGGGAPHLISVLNATAINPPEVQAAQQMMDPYMPQQVIGAPIFDEDTSKEVNTLRQDLDAYVAETTSKFITGALSFDKWDEYVETLEKLKVNRLQEIYQEAYDKTK